MQVGQLHYSLRQLRYFVVTAQVLSFSAAAKKLHISQPSVPTALADLEASFGVQLFIRYHARGLSPTQAGRDMLDFRTEEAHQDDLLRACVTVHSISPSPTASTSPTKSHSRHSSHCRPTCLNRLPTQAARAPA